MVNVKVAGLKEVRLQRLKYQHKLHDKLHKLQLKYSELLPMAPNLEDILALMAKKKLLLIEVIDKVKQLIAIADIDAALALIDVNCFDQDDDLESADGRTVGVLTQQKEHYREAI